MQQAITGTQANKQADLPTLGSNGWIYALPTRVPNDQLDSSPERSQATAPTQMIRTSVTNARSLSMTEELDRRHACLQVLIDTENHGVIPQKKRFVIDITSPLEETPLKNQTSGPSTALVKSPQGRPVMVMARTDQKVECLRIQPPCSSVIQKPSPRKADEEYLTNPPITPKRTRPQMVHVLRTLPLHNNQTRSLHLDYDWRQRNMQARIYEPIRDVIEYLNKKGYNKTEAMLRQEMSNVDAQGRSLIRRAEDRGGHKYFVAFSLLSHWIDDSLELYKAELRRLLWPIFVYSFLNLASEYYPDLSKSFFEEYSKLFTKEHADDLRSLKPISSPEHIEANTVAKAYRANKYRLTLTQAIFYNLMQFLEAKEKEGGSVLSSLLQNSLYIVTVDRTSVGNDRAFATMLARLHGENDIPDEDEGIPGHHPGSANTNPDAPKVLTRLYLGALPMDTDVSMDVRDELDEEDARNPPEPGENSLIEELDQRIKREPSDDAPTRDAVPLPKPLARDVAMEVQKIKEQRNRFRIGPRSSGVGPGVSVTMFTFHNTYDSVNCMDFSGDQALVAVGTAESYIRVWSLEGKPLASIVGNDDPTQPSVSSSRRLIGHSGPVYGISFSPSIASDTSAFGSVTTTSRHLLSCSADKSVRLWSLDTWSCLVVYKGHDQPVWDITWGPFGHYFLTGSHDSTARLWSTDHIAPLRLFVGHDQDVDCVTFHPNNAYVFTGSSDKTVRMWDVSRGSAVRLFTGHTANITALACAPSGRMLASADDAGNIILWDLAAGKRVKRMRGHSKGGVWSLSWSVESSLLVSGGADGTVRVWDVLQQTEGAAAPTKPIGDGTGTTATTAAGATSKTDSAGGNSASGGTGVGANGVVQGVVNSAVKKARGRDAMVTEDQINAFPTKKSPVYKVAFTNMNLVLAGGVYMP